MNERAFARARDAGDRAEDTERDVDIQPLEIVMPDALHTERLHRLAAFGRNRDRLLAGEIIAGQRLLPCSFDNGPEYMSFPPVLPRPGPMSTR